MKKLLIFCLLCLSNFSLGMTPNELVELNNGLASIALNKSLEEIERLKKTYLSEIQKTYRRDGENFVNYNAILKNGSIITVDYFVKGPLKGQYHGKKVIYTKNGFSLGILLNNKIQWYNCLKDLHQKSLKNKQDS